MFINRDDFEAWMKRIMERLEHLESKMDKPYKPEKPEITMNGEKLLDNQDLCFLLHVSKRTLQRYRVAGLLPCKRFDQKTYYLKSDVEKFIREHLQKPGDKPGK
jgi:DNA-binding transcriptional MerR regulator